MATRAGNAAEREWLVRADHQACQDFDKAITTLSSGALAISLVFVHDVAPHPRHEGLMIAAWALFASSLLLILLSFLTSHVSLRAEIRRIDTRADRSQPTCSAQAVTWLNRVSALALLLGVALLLAFAAINV